MKYAFTNGIILDGTKDMQPVRGKIIITDGDKIVDITNINFHDSVEILAIKNGLIIYEMSKKLRN